MKSFGISLLAPLAIGFSLSSCVDLSKVTTYSEASSATMKSKTISDGLTFTVNRRFSYRSAPLEGSAEKEAKNRVIKAASENVKKLGEVQAVYDKYFLALGALADKDLTNYKTHFDGFEKSLTGAEWVTKAEATAIHKLGQGIANLAAEGYRQREIKNLVARVDSTLQKGMRRLSEINNEYLVALDREDRASNEALQETLAANALQKPPIPPYIANSLRNQQIAEIDLEKKKSQAFGKAITAIGKGHGIILKDSENLRADEALESLKPQVEQIIAAYNVLNQ